jgi:hypothetical protein
MNSMTITRFRVGMCVAGLALVAAVAFLAIPRSADAYAYVSDPYYYGNTAYTYTNNYPYTYTTAGSYYYPSTQYCGGYSYGNYPYYYGSTYPCYDYSYYYPTYTTYPTSYYSYPQYDYTYYYWEQPYYVSDVDYSWRYNQRRADSDWCRGGGSCSGWRDRYH